jgi:hypothetical protein
MSEIFLPSRDYLYDDEVDKIVSDMDKNPSIFIPYLAKLRQYDAKPYYKDKLLTAIEKVEGTSKRTPAQRASEEPIDWFKNLKPDKSAEYEEPIDWFGKLKPDKSAELTEYEEPIDWFKNLKPYEPEEDSPVKPNHWKLVRNLVKILPLLKSEETTLNTALLEMRSIKNKREAMKLMNAHPANIRFIDPSIYTPEMIEMVFRDPQFTIFIDKSSPLIRHMLPQFLAVPNIFDYMVLDEFLTERHLYEFGFRTRFSIDDVHPGHVVYLHALCHGELIGPMEAPQKITRYSSVPLGVCEMLSSLKMSVIRRTTTYENFVENNVKHIGDLIKRTHYSDDDPRYVAVKKLAGVVPKKIVNAGTDIMNKIFSSEDVTPWHLNFLDIVTPSVKYNLFSIKSEWTLEEIVWLFGKEIVLCDYSCSKNKGFSQRVLDTTGGTKRKRTKRRKTKRF